LGVVGGDESRDALAADRGPQQLHHRQAGGGVELAGRLVGEQPSRAREYAMLDRAGRLQLPADYTAALGMADRILLELEEDHIQVWPDGNGDENGKGTG
jgi:hypothetical protein